MRGKKEEKNHRISYYYYTTVQESSCKMKWLFATKIYIGYNVPPPFVISPTPQSLTLFAFSSRGNARRGEETLGTRARNLSSRIERDGRESWALCAFWPPRYPPSPTHSLLCIHTLVRLFVLSSPLYISLHCRDGQASSSSTR